MILEMGNYLRSAPQSTSFWTHEHILEIKLYVIVDKRHFVGLSSPFVLAADFLQFVAVVD